MTVAPLTHFDAKGQAQMVDIAAKPVSLRSATAAATVKMQAATFALIKQGQIGKGDVLAVARLAGIMAAKRTSDLIPLCHPLALTSVAVEFVMDESQSTVEILATCQVSGKTGVEMEALTAATVAALTIYDMCKASDRAMEIVAVKLRHKSGGNSGEYHAAEVSD